MWKSLKDRAEGVKEMKRMKTTEAVGQVLCHDITQIIPGVTKDAVFRKGHIIGEEDIPVLLSVGKDSVYIWEYYNRRRHTCSFINRKGQYLHIRKQRKYDA